MKNSDIFNIASFEIFHACSEYLPIPAVIEASEVAMNVAGYFELSEDDQEFHNQFENIVNVVYHTLDWLIRENFLSDQGSSDTNYLVTFTLQGLNSINGVPSAISGDASFKDVFINGLSNISYGTVSGLMVELFKSGN
jgi:hypothetical protein